MGLFTHNGILTCWRFLRGKIYNLIWSNQKLNLLICLHLCITEEIGSNVKWIALCVMTSLGSDFGSFTLHDFESEQTESAYVLSQPDSKQSQPQLILAPTHFSVISEVAIEQSEKEREREREREWEWGRGREREKGRGERERGDRESVCEWKRVCE